MDQSEMETAFAELEGIEKEDINELIYDGELGEADFHYMYYDHRSNQYKMYYPTSDYYLNGRAREDYGVSVCYEKCEVSRYNKKTGIRTVVHFTPGDYAGVNVQVIECILKSEGKWK